MNKIEKLIDKRQKALEREEKARVEAEELQTQINCEIGSNVLDVCIKKSINTSEFFKILEEIFNTNENKNSEIVEELKDEEI